MKTPEIIRIVIFLILIIIIAVNFFHIRYLQKKIDNVIVLTYEDSTLIAYSPKSYKEPVILFTPDFIDIFNRYKSPFNDGLSFNELIKQYLKNRWADHYGCPRGTKEKKRIHEGIDFFVPENTQVFPLSNYGIVTEVSDDPHHLVKVGCVRPDGRIDSVKIEYGKIVRILYPEGIESVYAHLNEVYVEAGQEVNGDTKVGLTGLTGNIRNSGKASHLHLELRDKNNKSFDPRNRLRFTQASVKNFIEFLEVNK
ncbi:MAG: M23 family metallopeptidase [Candidatus Cloacimonetes bacterium]|nr:M23 family metallopeptidase [Candidatus Cloacimonadota bacterium]